MLTKLSPSLKKVRIMNNSEVVANMRRGGLPNNLLSSTQLAIRRRRVASLCTVKMVTLPGAVKNLVLSTFCKMEPANSFMSLS